jgi:predicted  nucleic acid-binding Zn-ribbon protein
VLTTIEKLLLLQERDRRIKQLTRESDDIPARKKLSETRLQEHKAAMQAAQEEIKRNAAAIRGVELDVETARQRILKFREQQNNIKTNEEYRAIEREIAGVEKQIRDLEDREILLMEESEGLRANASRMEQRLKQEETVVKADSDVLEQRLQNIMNEANALKAERATMVPEIDESWLSRYERTFKHTGDYALVPIESGSCGGCHMQLQPQTVQDVKKHLNMICCTFCGRILYWRR